MYVDVLLDQPVRHALTYQLTPDILPYVQVGSLLELPFGPKKLYGVVQSLRRRKPQGSVRIKSVLRLLVSKWVGQDTLTVAKALAVHTGEPPGICLFRLLPPPGKKITTEYTAPQPISGQHGQRYHLIAPRVARFREYLTMMQKAITAGQQTLLIIPTAYNQELERILPAEWSYATLHGGMSATRQRSAATRFATGQTQILIGTRHVIGWPAHALRWIIIDDASHPAHLDEQRPYADSATMGYIRHTVDHSHLVLGTGLPTPGMVLAEQEHKAKRIRLAIRQAPITLRHRRFEPELPAPDESKKPTTLLIAPRSGLGGSIHCQACDWTLACLHCDSELDIQPLAPAFSCYQCHQQTKRPTRCAACASSLLVEQGIGADAVRTQLEREHGQLPSTIRIGTEHELEAPTHYQTIIFLYADSPILSPRLDRPLGYARSISEARGLCDQVIVQTKHPDQVVWRLLSTNAATGYRELLGRRSQAQLPPYWRVLTFTQPISPKQLTLIRTSIGEQSREVAGHGMIYVFILRTMYVSTMQRLQAQLPTVRFRVDSLIDYA